jgi:ribosomal protein S18 acetylase RimI-like enzyme
MTVGVRVTPLRADRFDSWAVRTRAGFVAQQVAAGVLPEQEAAAYAEQQFAELLPDGLDTPGHRIWTVRPAEVDSEADIGHLWIRLTERGGQVEAFVVDVEVDQSYRGRGLGRAAMLLAEDEARALGASSMRLNVFGANQAAIGLYESLGYQPISSLMTRALHDADPIAQRPGPAVALTPMTGASYASYRRTAERDYAAEVAASGLMGSADARQKAADDYGRLLPNGRSTPEHHFWTATDGDLAVGMVWMHITERSDGLHVFAYDFRVDESRRRRGYGRSISVAAVRLCRERGVVSVGLNVFGSNPAAGALCDELGFRLSAMLMKKAL